MYRTWYTLINETKDSYQPDPDAISQLYGDVAEIYESLEEVKTQIEREQDQNVRNDAKRAAKILEEEIEHQIRYCIVCLNYKEANDPESDYSNAVQQARREYYASFEVEMPEKVGFALFRVIEDIGEVVINNNLAILVKDMEIMCDWQDMWPHYERGDVEVVADWGM